MPATSGNQKLTKGQWVKIASGSNSVTLRATLPGDVELVIGPDAAPPAQPTNAIMLGDDWNPIGDLDGSFIWARSPDGGNLIEFIAG